MLSKIFQDFWEQQQSWKWRNDRRSERNLCNCIKKPPKKFRTSMGFEPVTSRLQCDALPTKLWSHWRWSPDFFFQASLRNCITCVHCNDHFFISISFLPFIYEKFHISLIAKLLVVNMGLQRFPTTKEINIDNSQGINLQTGYHGSNRA